MTENEIKTPRSSTTPLKEGNDVRNSPPLEECPTGGVAIKMYI